MNKLLFNFFFAFLLLFVSLFAFSNFAFADSTCKYSASFKGQIYETSFELKLKNDNGDYTYHNFSFSIDGVVKDAGSDFRIPFVNISSNTCPEMVLYYEIPNYSKNILIGRASDQTIKNILNNNSYTIVPMYRDTSSDNNDDNNPVSPEKPNPNPPQKPDNPIYGSGGNNGNNPNGDGYILDYDGDVCTNKNVKNAVKVVGKVISIIQIAVPIILILMVLVDITKSIVSMDDSKSKKSVSHLIKRLISAVLVFFIIAIVRFVCQLIVGDSMESCLGLIANPW